MATKDISDIQVVQAFHDALNQCGLWPYDVLIQQTGQPLKVCLRAIERAESRGLIESGVSLRSGWLTEKGRELLLDTK